MPSRHFQSAYQDNPLRSLQMDTLRAAARLSGGPEKLARFLGVPSRALARWLKGEEKPPARVFAACSDLVLFHERHLS